MSDYTGGDLNLRGLAWGAAVIVGGIACALLASSLMLRVEGPAANTPPHPFRGAPPLLQPAPQPDRATYFAEKRRLLDSYGWVDRQAGIARIPLEHAMKLLAARGVTTPGVATPGVATPGVATPGVATRTPAANVPAHATPGRTPPVLAPREER
jgi:hypothetical protein